MAPDELKAALLDALNSSEDAPARRNIDLNFRAIADHLPEGSEEAKAVRALGALLFWHQYPEQLSAKGHDRFAVALEWLGENCIPAATADLANSLVGEVTNLQAAADLRDIILSADWRFENAPVALEASLDAVESLADADRWTTSFIDYLSIAVGIASQFPPTLLSICKQRLIKIAKVASLETRKIHDLAQHFLRLSPTLRKKEKDFWLERMSAAIDIWNEAGSHTFVGKGIELGENIARCGKDPQARVDWWLRHVDFQEALGDARAEVGDPLIAALHYRHANSVLDASPQGALHSEVKERSAALKRKVAEANRAGMAQMESHIVIEEIPADICQEWIDSVETAETKVEALRIIFHSLYLPDVELIETETRKFVESLPGLRIFTPSFFEEDGRPAGGGMELEVHKQVDSTIHQQLIRFVRLCFRPAVDGLKEKRRLTAHDLLNAFGSRNLVDPLRVEQLGRGFAYWLEGLAIEAVHLLIPELESMLRRIADSKGADVLKDKGAGFYHLPPLEATLKAAEETFLPSNQARLFRMILTTSQLKIGDSTVPYSHLNLRNKVCHGMVRDHALSIEAADCVATCLLHLLRWEVA